MSCNPKSPIPARGRLARLLRTATLPGDWNSARLNLSHSIVSTSLASARALAGSNSSSTWSTFASISGEEILPKLPARVVKIWLRQHSENASPTQENWVMSKSPTLT